MQANRGRDTKLELLLRRGLRDRGLRGYRTNYRVANTRVDVAFPAKMVAVLVNGCFWHHCPSCNPRLPKAHREYWRRKFSLTRARDKRVRRAVNDAGWTLVELWEHDLRDSFDEHISRIADALSGRSRERLQAEVGM
jgi:DNA mismatch endonuclease (patch repair protein)